MRLRKDGQRDRRYLTPERVANFRAKMPIIEAKTRQKFRINALKTAIAKGSVKVQPFQCTGCGRVVEAPPPEALKKALGKSKAYCKVCKHQMVPQSNPNP